MALTQEFESKKDRMKNMQSNQEMLLNQGERKWLSNRGKQHLLDFKDEEIWKLRECFNSLDDDGGGSIGLEELEDPLIGLGFAETREEVKELIDAVDDDGSGAIEFGEFLTIIKNSDASEKS